MGIQVLPQAVRDQIAAGEVVERPASVVKELIENAIDAGARAISIEVRDGGLRLIRVADDGCGMNRSDAALALERFSTSKIHSLGDLEAIQTLGFRGEALSSIAAVAEVEILTRAAHELEGTRVRAAEGSLQTEPAASPVGTSVTVQNLFVRFPGRRRFLKSRSREAELVQETVVRYALVYPQIAFRLIAEDRERLVAPRSIALARIGTLLGHDIAEEMIPIEWEALDLRVQGYVSRPSLGRNRRDRQYFTVNGRPIRSGLLAVMLERPYAGRLPVGRHPVCVVDITIAPPFVDVNVHPRKAEVRFSQERTIYGAVSRAVGNALYEYPRQSYDGELLWPFSGIDVGPFAHLAEEHSTYVSSGLHALAQLHSTYILAQTPDGLAIADQHAAHEQVLFEQLGHGMERAPLSPPVRLSLSAREVSALEGIVAVLDDLGIEVEPFGGQTYLIRTLPMQLVGSDTAGLVTALVVESVHYKNRDDDLRDRLAMKAACLGAIKAGDPLSLEQMQRLLEDLAQVWSPTVCPHGRPALVSISLEELARRFGR